MNHNTLLNYMDTVFSLSQHHKYSITDIENLHPFERDYYVGKLVNHLKEVEELKKQQQQ
jgi:hypothetical protein